MEKEKVIVTLTTWSARIGNIPAVLDTIFGQTYKPDKVVLNLAYDEVIPQKVQEYIDTHNVEVFRTEDTKVYKKLIPTLRRYPNDCIISIDDDWLYPEGMIEDFMATHAKYPDNPISGNKVKYKGLICHCGCASLTKAKFFGKYLDEFNASMFENCLSDDIAYTYFTLLAGHSYAWTEGEYFLNMKAYNAESSYSDKNNETSDILEDTFMYLTEKYGKLSYQETITSLLSDKNIAREVNDLVQEVIKEERMEQKIMSERQIRSTKAYRIGKAILTPYKTLRSCFMQHSDNQPLMGGVILPASDKAYCITKLSMAA